MGDRALVGRTLQDTGRNFGKVEVYYSHWGATKAFDAGENKPPVPEEPEEKRWQVADAKAFGLQVDYLHHEAVWLDGECYFPWCTFPLDIKDVNDWKTEGEGVLVQARTGEEFNECRQLHNAHYILQKIVHILRPDIVSSESWKAISINLLLGDLSSIDKRIPPFSPQGYGVEYKGWAELFHELNLDFLTLGEILLLKIAHPVLTER